MNFELAAKITLHLAMTAGRLVEALRRQGLIKWRKPDGSTVTNADQESERVIMEGLSEAFPNVPIVSEECWSALPIMPEGDTFWLVDPIDSTSSYAAGSDEYAVMIALVYQGLPVLGVIGAPGRDTYWVGSKMLGLCQRIDPGGARVEVGCRTADPELVVAVESPTSPSTIYPSPHITLQVQSAIKFGMVADGSVDVYQRHSSLSEWDIAAGQALVEAAGGTMRDLSGQAIRYGQPGLRTSGFRAQGIV